ncbi:ComEC/Rec2 family competence protein [Sphingobium boeckii]|uniref:Competence protein ComEC n=1 Tax=Sphingobium boeckii TaxID=1082345 RepID=A0A7W9AGI3_9SPHN|nr:ComEC/Rec2 family competence protein [Sphingobium boeckii]MBB5685092.1 competence protein ComEC [Sphingobium boeckii]
MARTTGGGSSTAFLRLQKPRWTGAGNIASVLENWLESERDQLALWMPVGLGVGIAAWFALPMQGQWIAFLLLASGFSGLGGAIGANRRLGRALIVFPLAAFSGCLLIWWQAERVAAPVLSRPVIEQFEARIMTVEPLPARESVRLLLRPLGVATLPPQIRVNLDEKDALAGLQPGAIVALRARIMPPPEAAVPGAYDFVRLAWFQQIGGTGRVLGKIVVVSPAPDQADGGGLRQRLSAHIASRLAGGEGAIASALATGDQGAIPEADAEAMRRSGLAHLLSVSGLHLTAAVGLTMLLVLRLLALSPWLALRWPLVLIAAAAGALVGLGYTLLTGSEVPTIRSLIAALLVLCGIALGRDAITLRLVAVGALIVLAFWPQSLVGPSFQLSFMAVTAIIAVSEHPRAKALVARRDERMIRRFGRIMLSLLITGLAVEIALAPIALYHFHKAGVYGALANIVAIPLTTFVIMPLEALALMLDLAGLGAPFWWLAGQALTLLLWVAHTVAASPAAVASLPTITGGAFGLMIAGSLWLCLWRTKVRRLGLIPVLAGAIWALNTPAPDILITGDGRHLAVRTKTEGYALLRPRAGDYVRDMLSESAGFEGDLEALDSLEGSRCSRDVCTIDLISGTRRFRLLATRSGYLVPGRDFGPACRDADIVVTDRRVPAWCTPRWIKADRMLLKETGGLSIVLADQSVKSVKTPGDDHPWIHPPHPVEKPYLTQPASTHFRPAHPEEGSSAAESPSRRTHGASFETRLRQAQPLLRMSGIKND